MTLSSRDILETWMSAFMDGELDFESSTALLEGLQKTQTFDKSICVA